LSRPAQNTFLILGTVDFG